MIPCHILSVVVQVWKDSNDRILCEKPGGGRDGGGVALRQVEKKIR
jgi:hypothetical protein